MNIGSYAVRLVVSQLPLVVVLVGLLYVFNVLAHPDNIFTLVSLFALTLVWGHLVDKPYFKSWRQDALNID